MPQVATRPWVATGAALVGASVVAAPAVAPLPDIEIASPEVLLTGAADLTFDIVGPWIDQLNVATDSIAHIANAGTMVPGMVLQQVIANQVGHLNDLIAGTSSIGDVFETMGSHAQNLLSSLFLVGASDEVIADTISRTLNGGHGVMHLALTDGIAGIFPAPAEPMPTLANLLSSPASGILMGLAGPVVSPFVAGWEGIGDIFTDLTSLDAMGAMQGLLELPAEVVGSIFNGATLNLDALIPLVSQLGLFPDTVTLNAMELAFGGLFTGGDVSALPYAWLGPDATLINPIAPMGGSMFNALGLDLTADLNGFLAPFPAEAAPIGPIGAIMGLQQIVAAELGFGEFFESTIGSGKNAVTATGIMPIPPLSTIDLPAFDLAALGFDDGGMLGSLSGLLGDLPGVDMIGDLLNQFLMQLVNIFIP